MIKAVVFDLDHTLFDRYETYKKIFRERDMSALPLCDGITLDAALNGFMDVDRCVIHNDNPWEWMLKTLIERGILKDIGMTSDEFHAQFIFPSFSTVSVPFSFTEPTLDKLRAMGLKTALITNGTYRLQNRKLDNLNIRNKFDEIIIAGEESENKPSIEPFLLMAQRLNLKPSEMLYVGDNPLNDVDASRKAGYIPVWVKTTGTWIFPEIEKPELQIETIEELPKIIDAINKTTV